jgi:hypothetical protein
MACSAVHGTQSSGASRKSLDNVQYRLALARNGQLQADAHQMTALLEHPVKDFPTLAEALTSVANTCKSLGYP